MDIFICSFQGTEIGVGALLLSRAVSSQVPSAAQVLTIVFGMGTGVSPARISTNICDNGRTVGGLRAHTKCVRSRPDIGRPNRNRARIVRSTILSARFL